ncbi:MAG: glycosyltransferase family 39 protein, partial [Candidatus Shapirobacteria bacterium]|nr:glycosyltransferase family 39 protein [Candidatus Shapirobacteria bacterium]
MLKRKLLIPVLLLLFILPTFYFFLKPGIYWNMHDDMQVIRQLSMEKCIIDGQIPCRWVPDLGYEYGYPLFNYYPPLPYFIGEIFRFFRFSFIDTIKLVAATQIILTAFFMYLLAKSLTGRLGGLLSAIFYTYAPYHAVNIYIRGAMNEAWASTFFPLVLYFIRQLVLKPKLTNLFGLDHSFSGILLTHNPMALLFVPICLVWLIFWLIKSNNSKNRLIYIYLTLSAILSISLSAFFTLPLIFEAKYVQIGSMFSGYYNYSVHFATFFQLFFSNFWGDGPSVWGTEDKMSFMIGYLHWLIPLVVFIFSLYKFSKTKNKTFIIPIILFLLGLAYAFMAHERSTPIWILLTPIQNIQFPWRFLNPVIFLMSLSVAYFPRLFKIRFFSIAVMFLVIIINYKYFYPIHSGPITDQQKFSGESWRLLTTASIYDYLPKTASTAAKQPAKPYLDAISPETVKYQISGAKRGTDWLFYNLNLDSPSTITLPILAFPGFKLSDFGK